MTRVVVHSHAQSPETRTHMARVSIVETKATASRLARKPVGVIAVQVFGAA